MNRYMCVSVGDRKRISSTSMGDVHTHTSITQMIGQGWKLYGSPVYAKWVSEAQMFVKDMSDVADPESPYTDFIIVYFQLAGKDMLPITDIDTKLREGWKLYGLPYARESSGYYQPMVKPSPIASSPSAFSPSASAPSASSSSPEFDSRAVPAPPSGKGRNTRRAFRQRHKKY
jgi:hypothetical protein